MVVVDIQNLTGLDTTNKAFIVFEKLGAGIRGIYYNEFLKTSNALQNPDDAFNQATKIIDANTYQNRNIRNIFLYSQPDGSDITVTILTAPDGLHNMQMYTGRVVNGQYLPCDGGVPKVIHADNLTGSFAFYYNNGEKNKFYTYTDATSGAFTGDGEAH